MRKPKARRRRAKKITAAVIIFIAAFIAFELLISKYALTVSEYEISTDKIEEDIRIVQLTDLHNSSFGKNNARLLEKVSDQNPDIILITGDLINSADEDISAALFLISALCDIAPVYISPGNHEAEYEENYGADIEELYEEAADESAYTCTVLDYEYTDISVNGQNLRIGGIYGYCLPEEYLITGEASEEECAFLNEMQDTDLYTVLLCHMPVCWTYNDGLNKWNINCVLTGHAHGGQIIIPGLGGLWAPDMGFFPGKLEGIVFSDDGENTLVYSRGLGNSDWLPRFNNIPEIVVVDLTAE